ncbi:MAG: CvpA family protein [Gemmatimonadetes bacterium]|nr:CvpA family protein [Gemmatimonadota bacterium]
MNWLDLGLLAFVVAVGIGGLGAGFVKGAANLVGLILGFVLGSALFPTLTPLFLRWTSELPVASLFAFTVVALAAVFLLDVIGSVAARIVALLRLQPIDRPLGVLPATLSAVLIAGVTLALLNGFALIERQRSESRLSSWFLQVSAPIVHLLPPPWNGQPAKLPPSPIPAPDAPALALRRDIASVRDVFRAAFY